ncbi:serine hydrolase domain-containing protein [candidate division CSSED10-310 bacterium]|uniref:Serine hydrolase domain-containing protein n=1 Tax=candidate division CSSED10-310 bacterium TaxID=2855610 RepID=A0ABV6Z5B3_UNCC1
MKKTKQWFKRDVLKMSTPDLVAIILIFLLAGFLLSCPADDDDSTTQTDDQQFLGQGPYDGEYWPTDQWRSCSPEEVGFNSERLLLVYDYLANPAINTQGVVIIKDGYIVAEAYFGYFNQNRRHHSYSMAKSFLSALIGIALDKGYLSGVESLVYPYFPEWQQPDTEPEKQRMTIRNLLTMTSGLQWDESNYYDDTVPNDAYLMGEEDDYIQYVLNKPSLSEPGDAWCYSSGDSMLLSGIIQEVSQSNAYQFGLQYLLEPIGLSSIIWHSDPAGHTIGGWGIEATVRQYAKFGYLYLNNGQWDNEQIVSAQWVAESIKPAAQRWKFYGYQWWLLPVFNGYKNTNIPPSTFLAWGIYTQQMFIIQEKNLLVVRVANDPGSSEWDELEFLTMILDALIQDQSQ